MSKSARAAPQSAVPATSEDIRRVFGDLDVAVVLDILALNPTVRDIDRASLWLAGDTDIFGAGEPLKGVAGEIVSILTAGEEEERA